MLCICSGMTCSAYIQLQWRKAVFNLQKILSLQSRTQMIILFLAVFGFITFFFCRWWQYSLIQARDQYFVVGLVNYGFTCSGYFIFCSNTNKNIHHASNHRRSASSLCEDGQPSGQEVHHVGFQERFLWRYKLLNIIIWRNKHLCDFTNTWT